MIELYFDNTRIHLDEKANISQTLQANDLTQGLSNRQRSVTSSFKIPVRPNLTYFENLGIPGNVSSKPYTTITARLVEDGIEQFSNGRAIIKKAKDGYFDCQIIIDGDLYDELGKKKLPDIAPARLWPKGESVLEIDSSRTITDCG